MDARDEAPACARHSVKTGISRDDLPRRLDQLDENALSSERGIFVAFGMNETDL